MKHLMQRRAFTLVELLVVVAVLAIIAAILFPVFARRRNDPHRPSCQNNLKQLALGFKQYLNDFDERFPIVAVTTTTGTTYAPPYGWADALQPYIRNTQVYQCPSDADEGTDNSGEEGFSDYWYNANFMVFHKGQWTGATESMLGSVSQTVIAGDGGNAAGNPTGDARYNVCGDGTSLSRFGQRCTPAPVGFATYPAAQLHSEGANFAYADGHVKWQRGSSPAQSSMILSNGMTQKTIAEPIHSGRSTFSLLAK